MSTGASTKPNISNPVRKEHTLTPHHPFLRAIFSTDTDGVGYTDHPCHTVSNMLELAPTLYSLTLQQENVR